MNKSVNQFTYAEGDQCVMRGGLHHFLLTGSRYVFMNLDTFEETRMPKARGAYTRCRGPRAEPCRRTPGPST